MKRRVTEHHVAVVVIALGAAALAGCQPKTKLLPGFTKEVLNGAATELPRNQAAGAREGQLVVGHEPLGLDPVYPEFRCMELGCPANVKCGTKVLVVVHCGTGKCKFCGKSSPAGNLVTKAWCSYAGLGGEGAFGFITRFGNTFVGPVCLPGDSHNTYEHSHIATDAP